MRFLVPLFFLLAACSYAPYSGCDVCGADEFVIDSYQVREGKFAILEMNGQCYPYLEENLLAEERNEILEGDLLRVTVHHPSRKDLAATVDAIGNNIGYRVCSGAISLPCLSPVYVAGLTVAEARARVEEAFCEEISGIEVFLKLSGRECDKVELMGMVQSSSISADGKKRLFEVLSEAKVPTNANLFKSYVVRNGQILPVDLCKLVKQGDMSQNIVIRGGDKIYIAEPAASTVIMLGEVGKPQAIPVPDGYLSLRQALGMAGGIPFTGDMRSIQVIRGSVVQPKIYTLSWEHIVQLPTDSLLLIPGDIVYIASTPITRWDRFVNQVLPTIVGLDLILRGAKSVGVIVP